MKIASGGLAEASATGARRDDEDEEDKTACSPCGRARVCTRGGGEAETTEGCDCEDCDSTATATAARRDEHSGGAQG